MSPDAFLMPAPPQLPAGGGRPVPGSAPSTLKHDRSTPFGDRARSFLSTLNRISDRQSCRQPRPTADEGGPAKCGRRLAESAPPTSTCPLKDPDPALDQTAELTGTTSDRDGRQPAIGLIVAHLIDRLLTEADSTSVDAGSDSDPNPAQAFLQRVLETLQAERQRMRHAEVGIGPFEQLQTQFSPEANPLHVLKQLVSRAIQQQLAADPSGPRADTRFSHFWHALATAPIEEGTSGSQTQAFRDRIDALVNYLLKQHETHGAARGVPAVSAEASAPQTDAKLAAFGPTEHLLSDKMAHTAAPTEGHASDMSKLANPDKDGQLFAGLPKDFDSEATTAPRLRQGDGNSQAAKTPVALKAADQAFNPNIAAESIGGKPSEAVIGIKNAGLPNNMPPADQAVNPNIAAESIGGKPSEAVVGIKNAGLPNNMPPADQAVNPNLAAESISGKPSEAAMDLKNEGLPNDLLPADKAGNKVIQIDAESKDSSFWAQQEHLAEHLTKSKHAARSPEVAQRSLASQTLNQIVQKAVLMQSNGQHAVQIDLKPDFLGQIRMQIISEGQQVAVRIVAELPFVKDMLENNLNQLKAELQAQGLQVDELEVSVAHDSRADDDRQQKHRARQLKNSRMSVDRTDEQQTDRLIHPGDESTETVIDFFA